MITIEIRDSGALMGSFATIAEASEYLGRLTEAAKGVCPNCGKETAYSSFYDAQYCFHCYFWVREGAKNDAK